MRSKGSSYVKARLCLTHLYILTGIGQKAKPTISSLLTSSACACNPFSLTALNVASAAAQAAVPPPNVLKYSIPPLANSWPSCRVMIKADTGKPLPA